MFPLPLSEAHECARRLHGDKDFTLLSPPVPGTEDSGSRKLQGWPRTCTWVTGESRAAEVSDR